MYVTSQRPKQRDRPQLAHSFVLGVMALVPISFKGRRSCNSLILAILIRLKPLPGRSRVT